MREYKGYEALIISDEEVEELFDPNNTNTFETIRNQYVNVFDNKMNDLGIFRNDGSRLVKVPFKTINSQFLGKVKPKNPQQQMAVDLLYNQDITIKLLTGKFGTGKDFLMCSAAIDLLERNKFEKIIYIRNNIEVKNSKPIGFLPGEYNDKLLPFAMPLADHLGGKEGLNMWISRGRIEIVHLGFIRGRDIKNSIIYCSEAENMTKEHIRLLIGRVGEGSALWINGDFEQCDAEVFRTNSGLMMAVERLKGQPLFGYVRLEKTERSETAALADLLD